MMKHPRIPMRARAATTLDGEVAVPGSCPRPAKEQPAPLVRILLDEGPETIYSRKSLPAASSKAQPRPTQYSASRILNFPLIIRPTGNVQRFRLSAHRATFNTPTASESCASDAIDSKGTLQIRLNFRATSNEQLRVLRSTLARCCGEIPARSARSFCVVPVAANQAYTVA